MNHYDVESVLEWLEAHAERRLREYDQPHTYENLHRTEEGEGYIHTIAYRISDDRSLPTPVRLAPEIIERCRWVRKYIASSDADNAVMEAMRVTALAAEIQLIDDAPFFKSGKARLEGAARGRSAIKRGHDERARICKELYQDAKRKYPKWSYSALTDKIATKAKESHPGLFASTFSGRSVRNYIPKSDEE